MRETQQIGSLLSSASPLVSTYIAVSFVLRVDVRTSLTAADSPLVDAAAAAAPVVDASNLLLSTPPLLLVAVTCASCTFR